MTTIIDQKLKQVIVDHLGVNADQVTSTASFATDLQADSLDALDLLMAINEAYRIKIPAESLPEINTVAQMQEQIQQHLK